MAPGAVLRQTSGAGRHAAPQCSLRRRSGHPDEPAAGARLQTVGGSGNVNRTTFYLMDRIVGGETRLQERYCQENVSTSVLCVWFLMKRPICVRPKGFHHNLFSHTIALVAV